MDAFEPVLKKARESGQQACPDVPGGTAAPAAPTGAAATDPDTAMADADEPGSPAGGWEDGAVDVTAMHVSDGARPASCPEREPPACDVCAPLTVLMYEY